MELGKFAAVRSTRSHIHRLISQFAITLTPSSSGLHDVRWSAMFIKRHRLWSFSQIGTHFSGLVHWTDKPIISTMAEGLDVKLRMQVSNID
jgi:hypothetical protein